MKEKNYESRTAASCLPLALICTGIGLAALVTYLPVLDYSFVHFDDRIYVAENTLAQEGLGWESLKRAFSGGENKGIYWIPLTWISFIIDFEVHGLSPGGCHGTNLIFHMAGAILLFLAFNTMTRRLWPSVFIAAVFALHPLHVESVAWVAERKDVLCAFFWILAMYAYAWHVRRPGIMRYLAVTACFIMSLMSKPMAVTLPLALLLLDFWPLGRIDGLQSFIRLFREKIPLLALSAMAGVAAFAFQESHGALASLDLIPLSLRIQNTVVSYAAYLVKMIRPAGLAVLYPYPESIPAWKTALAALTLTGVFILSIAQIKRRPYIGFGFMWYVIVLLPVSGLAVIGPHAMADRYAYLPMIGLSAAAAWAGSEFFERIGVKKPLAMAVGAAAILAMGFGASNQARFWKNSETLFNRALEVTEDNYIVHHNLGLALARQDRLQEAAFHFEKALAINPHLFQTHCHLGNLMLKQGKIDQAIERYEKALEIQPDDDTLHLNLGSAHLKTGSHEKALTHYEKSLEVNPDNYIVHNNMGALLYSVGRKEKAFNHYRKALKLNPRFTGARINYAQALANSGNEKKAEEQLGILNQIEKNPCPREP